MRLPAPSELTTDGQRRLHEFDLREYHNPDRHSFVRLGYVNRLRLMLKRVGRLGRGLRVLDIGCAQGNLSILLAEAGHEVTATDLRPDYLEYVRLKYERGTLHLAPGNAQELPFGQEFDVVVLGELLEHAAHPEQLLKEASSKLRPGGHLLITTPNAEYVQNRLPDYSSVGTGEQLEARQFAPDADGHLFLFTGRQLTEVTRRAGLKPGRVKYHNSPFATGAMRWRVVGRALPVWVCGLLEGMVRRLPWLRRKLCTGMMVLAGKGPQD